MRAFHLRIFIVRFILIMTHQDNERILPDRHTAIVNTVEQYQHAFMNGEQVDVRGLCGRLLRGKTPADFELLTDDANREIVMLMGPDGLAELPGRTGYEMLEVIGYTREHIAERVAAGNRFKLAVFPEGEEACVATWDNVTDLASRTYPAIQDVLETHLPDLKIAMFKGLEATTGYSFHDVDCLGKADERYMTYARFCESPQDLVATRAFYYFTLHLRELFSGDGYTYDHTGGKGVVEYIIRNKPVRELGESALMDLEVVVPFGS
jgi:hypothetical protein